MTQSPITLPGFIGLTVSFEFQDGALMGTHMAVSRLKKPVPKPTRISPRHQLVLDILEGRAKLKSDSQFCRIKVVGTKFNAEYEIKARLTDHQRKVYNELIGVRAGKTVSYGVLAKAVGSAPRAVGWTMSHNPFPFLVPCHRVVRSDGSIGGWTPISGIWLKEALLNYESGQRCQGF